MTATRSALFRAALLALAGATLLPAGAQAYWRGGFFFGLPGVYLAPPFGYPYPPVYSPAPLYMAPPPAYSMPFDGGPPPAGQACYAGRWVCPLDRLTPIGDACSCPGNGGRIWGRAN